MSRSTQHAFEPEEVMAYFDGELEARQAAALASHLEHCSECQAMAAQLKQVSERLLDFQIESCSPKTVESVLDATERNAENRLRFAVEIKPMRRRGLRILAWASASAIVLLLVLATAIPNYLHTKMAADEAGRVSVNYDVLPLAPQPPKPAPSHGRALTDLQTFATPGIVPDSNGIFHGLGDHAGNSLSIDGVLGGGNGKLESERAQSVEAPEIRGPMIVQTASITILAQNYDQASRQIQPLATARGGYAQDVTLESRKGTARSVSATLRVPDGQLESFLEDLRKLGHAEQETRNNQEVTGGYIDLTARLKTARATEQRIIQLLGTRTGKLSDVLEAEQELERIRGEIESMDGERAHMEHQVRYATVQVQLNEEYREQLNPESFSTGRRLRNSVVEGLGNLAAGITGAAIFVFAYGPSILFWLALLTVPSWFIWRRFKKVKSA